MSSFHRPSAPWVSSSTLDRLLGPSHLPSDAGVQWCAVRLHAVLDSLAGPATPRCSGVHGHAGPLDRPAGLHVASCATSVLDPGPSAPPRTSEVGGGVRGDLPHCGAEQTAVVRGDRRAGHVSADRPHSAAGRGGGAPGLESPSCGTRRFRPDRSAPRLAAPRGIASHPRLHGGNKEVTAANRSWR